MRLFIDDIRPAPDGYKWCNSVNEAKEYILDMERLFAYHFRRGGYTRPWILPVCDKCNQ